MTRPRTDSSTASDPVLEIVVADFEEFFAREYPGLLAMLTALTGHRTVAEDLAQEAMVKAHQRWSRISGYDKPAAWLRRVAGSLSICSTITTSSTSGAASSAP